MIWSGIFSWKDFFELCTWVIIFLLKVIFFYKELFWSKLSHRFISQLKNLKGMVTNLVMLWNMVWKIILKFIILYLGTKVDWPVTNVVTKLKILKILLSTENLAFKNFLNAKFVIVDLPPNKAAICIQEVSSYRVSQGKITNFRPTL